MKPLALGQAGLWYPGQNKPQGVPRINWSHPLAQGLVLYLFDTGMSAPVDLVGNRPPAASLNPGNAPPNVSPYGTGLLYGNTTWGWTADALIQSVTASGSYSFACGEYHAGTPAANARPFGRTANNNSSPFLNWIFQAGSTAGHMQCYMFGNSTFNQIGGDWTGDTNNAFHTLVGVATSTTSASFYADGALVGSTTLGAGTWGSSNTNDDVLISGGSAAGVNNGWSGLVYYGAFWNRPLNASEIQLLHLDPYAFLEPQPAQMEALPRIAGTETSTATLALSGVSFAASGGDATGAGAMRLSGVTFSGAGHLLETSTADMALSGVAFAGDTAREETGAATLALGNLAFAGIASRDEETMTSVFALGAPIIRGSAIDLVPTGTGRRSFWLTG